MSEQTPEITRRRCPVWVKALLGLSLALNFAIVGLVAGLALRGGPLRSDKVGLGYAMPYIAALDREGRRAVFQAVRKAPKLSGRSERRAQFREMATALRQNPLDRVAVAAVLARQSESVSLVQDSAQAQWLEIVAEMSVDERAAYVDDIEEVLRKGPKWRKDCKPRN